MLLHFLQQWLRRNYIVIAALVMVFLGFVVLLQLNPQSLTRPSQIVRIQFADNISSAHLQVIELFNRRYAGRIEVIPVDLPFEKFSTNERKELLTRALRSKSNRLDVFAVDQIWVPRFAKWAEPLDPYLAPEVRQNLLAEALNSCFYQGRLVGVPLYIDLGILYYRRDLLARLPDAAKFEESLQQSITWEDFIRLHRRFPAGSGPFYLYPADAFEGLICCYVENVASLRYNITQDTLAGIRAPEGRRALQLLVDLVHRYGMTPPEVAGFKEVDVYDYALQKDALFFRGWPGNLKKYERAMPEKIAAIGMAPLPHFAGFVPRSTFGGWNLMVSRNSTRKMEAIVFLQFLMTEEAQKILFTSNGYLPVNKKVYADSSYCSAHPDLAFLRALFDRGIHRPASVHYTRISDILSNYIHLAIKGDIPVDDALQKADAQISRELPHWPPSAAAF